MRLFCSKDRINPIVFGTYSGTQSLKEWLLSGTISARVRQDAYKISRLILIIIPEFQDTKTVDETAAVAESSGNQKYNYLVLHSFLYSTVTHYRFSSQGHHGWHNSSINPEERESQEIDPYSQKVMDKYSLPLSTFVPEK